MLMRIASPSWLASIKFLDMEMNTRNQKDDLWLYVAFEIKLEIKKAPKKLKKIRLQD